MPIESIFEPENNLIRITFDGKITADEVLQETLAQRHKPEFRPEMNALCDFSTTEFVRIDFTTISNYLVYMPEVENMWGKCRWALVSQSKLNFGILRMFELSNSDSPIEMKVFRSLSEGHEWLEYEMPK